MDEWRDGERERARDDVSQKKPTRSHHQLVWIHLERTHSARGVPHSNIIKNCVSVNREKGREALRSCSVRRYTCVCVCACDFTQRLCRSKFSPKSVLFTVCLHSRAQFTVSAVANGKFMRLGVFSTGYTHLPRVTLSASAD